MMQKGHVGGFWSYVHHDDHHENGRIIRLRDRLEHSVRFFSGITKFRIFLDRKDIGWGEQWKERLATSVGDALLLFPIVTPSYFVSAACREEALAFRDRQASLARGDLILPIYYLTTPHFDNAELATPGDEEAEEVAALLRAHQYEDWRALRDMPETDPAYAKAVERLAQKAVEALARTSPSGSDAGAVPPASPKSAPGPRHRDTPASAESAQVETAGELAGSPGPGLIITFTVNPMPGRGHFTSISEAIARVPGGARILVAPGHYREPLVIDKPLELIGDGPREDIIVEVEGSTAVVFDTNIGVIRNLTFRQNDKHRKYFCLSIKQGRLELEDCDLSSTSLTCLTVGNNADPRVRRSRIHHGAQGGILIHDNGRGTYEENEIFGNALAGVSVKTGADPVIRRNRIFDGRASGVLIFEGGRGTFEDNEIFGNGLAGLEAREGAEPVVRRTSFYDNQGGILVSQEARGTFEDNEISGNARSGIEIRAEADPIMRRNRVQDGKQDGIYVHAKGRGTLEHNHIAGNRRSGIIVGPGGSPVVRSNVIVRNGLSGVRVMKDGTGVFEDNELSGNGKPWDLDPSAESHVERNGNQET